jgi:membrane peptidoglycan carboxypeptidase
MDLSTRRLLVQRVRWSRRFAPIVVVALFMALAPPLGVAYASRLPDVSAVSEPLPSDTVLYAADNTTILADLHPAGYQHYDESLSSMGRYLPDATIAIEDHNFYQEPGVDPAGIVRATVVDLKARSTVEGASTITQQLVKLRVLGGEPTLQRKLNEAWLAFEVERRYSKSQVLEMYLNDVPFGNSAVGASAASQLYFHKKTSDLDLAQAAMLAGLIRGPSHYDPFLHWQAAKDRQHDVLAAMVDQGKISQLDADRAFKEDLTAPNHMFIPANNVVAPGFVNYVIQNLIKTFGKAETYGGGLRVLTTLNVQLQAIGQNAISGTQSSLSWRNVQQGALVAIDPTSGAIIAMVSSANPNANGGQYNLAVWPPRNPGSSMKIFTYTAAINSGQFTMTTPIQDAPFTYRAAGITYTPQNYDGHFHGVCQLQECIGNSLNIPAVKVELGVGVANVVDMARLMGAPPWQQQANGSFTNDDPVTSFGPSLTLGGYGETPLQMATGASVLAAQGVLHKPFAISRVDQGGKTIYSHADDGKQVVDPKVAFIMATMLSKDSNRAMIFGRNSQLVIPGWQVAVKTGTSDSFADAWSIGFTPRIAVAVWMGNPDWRIKMTQGSDSYYVAVPAWHSFLSQGLPLLGSVAWYNAPAGIISAFGNYYLPGTQPTSPPQPSSPGPGVGGGGGGGHKKHGG